MAEEVVEPAEKPEEAPVDIEEQTKVQTRSEADNWDPRTELGRKVKNGEITSMQTILQQGLRVAEIGIVDKLLPDMESELLMIGQSKGKFGGGARRIFKQTQKKTPEGNKPSFACMAVVGNRDGYVGIGYGKSKDTVPAREKAIRNAKRNIFRVRRGAGSWEDASKEPHSIPFTVEGKCGSVRIKLIPAPKGKGLVVEKECAKVLALAGIRNVYSKTSGQTNTKSNLIWALLDALHKLTSTKTRPADREIIGAEL